MADNRQTDACATPAPNTACDLRCELDSDPIAVRECLVALVAGLESRGVSADARSAAEIVLAEILNNIVEHAYREQSGGTISICISFVASAIRFDISDQGAPLPGLKLPLARRFDPTCPTADLPEGGFGWALIRDMTRNLRYRRVADQNELGFEMTLDGSA